MGISKKIINLIIASIIGLLFTSCGFLKEVPVQTIEKTIYKDSLIYVKDVVTVEVPHEIIKEIAFMYDTSVIKTSVAESVAYVDTAKKRLFHTLTQKGEIEIKYDTILNIQFVDKIIEKDIPIEVEVIKYKRDALFWVLVGWAILCLFFLILKMFVLK